MYKKTPLIACSIIYQLVRWGTMIIVGFLMILTYIELFTFENKDFYRYVGANSWNYASADYYLISTIVDATWTPLVFIMSIYARRMKKWIYLAIIFSLFLLLKVLNSAYSADNPPEWCLYIFNFLN